MRCKGSNTTRFIDTGNTLRVKAFYEHYLLRHHILNVIEFVVLVLIHTVYLACAEHISLAPQNGAVFVNSTNLFLHNPPGSPTSHPGQPHLYRDYCIHRSLEPSCSLPGHLPRLRPLVTYYANPEPRGVNH